MSCGKMCNCQIECEIEWRNRLCLSNAQTIIKKWFKGKSDVFLEEYRLKRHSKFIRRIGTRTKFKYYDFTTLKDYLIIHNILPKDKSTVDKNNDVSLIEYSVPFSEIKSTNCAHTYLSYGTPSKKFDDFDNIMKNDNKWTKIYILKRSLEINDCVINFNNAEKKKTIPVSTDEGDSFFSSSDDCSSEEFLKKKLLVTEMYEMDKSDNNLGSKIVRKLYRFIRLNEDFKVRLTLYSYFDEYQQISYEIGVEYEFCDVSRHVSPFEKIFYKKCLPCVVVKQSENMKQCCSNYNWKIDCDILYVIEQMNYFIYNFTMDDSLIYTEKLMIRLNIDWSPEDVISSSVSSGVSSKKIVLFSFGLSTFYSSSLTNFLNFFVNICLPRIMLNLVKLKRKLDGVRLYATFDGLNKLYCSNGHIINLQQNECVFFSVDNIYQLEYIKSVTKDLYYLVEISAVRQSFNTNFNSLSQTFSSSRMVYSYTDEQQWPYGLECTGLSDHEIFSLLNFWTISGCKESLQHSSILRDFICNLRKNIYDNILETKDDDNKQLSSDECKNTEVNYISSCSEKFTDNNHENLSDNDSDIIELDFDYDKEFGSESLKNIGLEFIDKTEEDVTLNALDNTIADTSVETLNEVYSSKESVLSDKSFHKDVDFIEAVDEDKNELRKEMLSGDKPSKQLSYFSYLSTEQSSLMISRMNYIFKKLRNDTSCCSSSNININNFLDFYSCENNENIQTIKLLTNIFDNINFSSNLFPLSSRKSNYLIEKGLLSRFSSKISDDCIKRFTKDLFCPFIKKKEHSYVPEILEDRISLTSFLSELKNYYIYSILILTDILFKLKLFEKCRDFLIQHFDPDLAKKIINLYSEKKGSVSDFFKLDTPVDGYLLYIIDNFNSNSKSLCLLNDTLYINNHFLSKLSSDRFFGNCILKFKVFQTIELLFKIYQSNDGDFVLNFCSRSGIYEQQINLSSNVIFSGISKQDNSANFDYSSFILNHRKCLWKLFDGTIISIYIDIDVQLCCDSIYEFIVYNEKEFFLIRKRDDKFLPDVEEKINCIIFNRLTIGDFLTTNLSI